MPSLDFEEVINSFKLQVRRPDKGNFAPFFDFQFHWEKINKINKHYCSFQGGEGT